jgi:hypothetical protein
MGFPLAGFHFRTLRYFAERVLHSPPGARLLRQPTYLLLTTVLPIAYRYRLPNVPCKELRHEQQQRTTLSPSCRFQLGSCEPFHLPLRFGWDGHKPAG